MSEVARRPLVLGNKTYKDISDDLCQPVETFPTKTWFSLFFAAKSLLVFYLIHIAIIVCSV
jgi:hypothetical protein